MRYAKRLDLDTDTVLLAGSTITMWSFAMAIVDADSVSSSNAPGSFFRQHHEVEGPEVSARAFRPAWRVRTKLDQLALEGKITGFE